MRLKHKLRTHSLNISLVRADLKTDAHILENIDELTKIELRLPADQGEPTALPLEATLYFPRRPKSPPKWADFFGDLLKEYSLPEVASAPAILLIRVQDRTFALAFSYGSALLQPGTTDTTFGLRVALNSVARDRVRSYDKRSFDALFRQTREQAAKETRLESFGIDAERDLVRKVTGTPTDRTLGSGMTGGSSLRVSVKTNPRKLPDYLEKLYRKSRQLGYKKEYPWIDSIEEVTDAELTSVLDDDLNDELLKDEPQAWLAVPEIIDWDEFSGFRFILPSRNANIYSSISLDNLLRATNAEDVLTADFLKKQRVELLDPNHERLKQWTIYSCVNAELRVNKETYVLSSGTWYKIDRALIESVDDDIHAIPRTNLPLHRFSRQDKEELQYNQNVSRNNPQEFCTLDRELLGYGQNKNSFELCDLLHRTGDLIHVKRYGGSSVLSHLFAQGYASSHLLRTREDFREDADRLVKERGFSLLEGKSFQQNAPRRVVFVIVGGSRKEGQPPLPPFARINLRSSVRNISYGGWSVAIQFVEETKLFRLLTIKKRRERRKGRRS